MKNDYKSIFKNNVNKLLTEGEDYSWMDDDDELPPLEWTKEEKEAMNTFDAQLERLKEGLITRKDFITIVSKLYNHLPNFDYLRNKDAKLPKKFN